MNATDCRVVLIRDLVLQARIGIFAHEQGAAQRVRFNIELGVPDRPPQRDSIREVVRYDHAIDRIRQIVDAGHVNLVETLAERVAAQCLAIAEVLWVRVRVEKLDIAPDAASVGIEIFRKGA
ncbi:MAG: dihydroneopterin aldolase [Magnetospirillum sp.]|jgi:7,8-dihydroneopterin aldolase/epimerase/oxygenase|nr:dihydroneopterin aldolase [Magnetospirillum sp.]